MPKRTKQLPPDVIAYMSALGRKGGAVSGSRRMTNLTPKQRTTIARTAAVARWTKKKVENKG